MRKIIVISMVTMDGVMQAPGGPDEDTADGFKYGGWTAPYAEAGSAEPFQKLMKPADLLLGRKTFDIFEGYWPKHADAWPGVNEVKKYVFSNTRDKSDWKNTEFLHSVNDIRKLKYSSGDDIKVWGSSRLIQLLLSNDLADEIWMIIHPVTLGTGKKLFEEGTIPAAFALMESAAAGGVIFAHYKRAGEVKTGTVGE